jgi:hypothetical protein
MVSSQNNDRVADIFNRLTMIQFANLVNPLFGRNLSRKERFMHDRIVTPDIVPVIKLARNMNIPYSWISSYFPGLNFGRIADIMAGRLYPDIPPADALPPDFPTVH